jgi:hypothetical protein
MNINSFEKQKIDRIKELLAIPSNDRTDKNLLEVMSFTKVILKLTLEFQNI